MIPRVKFGFGRARKSFAAAAEIIRSGRGKHLQRSGKTGEDYSNTLRSPYSHPAKAMFATYHIGDCPHEPSSLHPLCYA